MHRFAIQEPRFLPHAACELEIELRKGQLTVVMGENGIGKSSLLRHLYKVTKHSAVLVEQTSQDYFFDRTLGKIKQIILSSVRVEAAAFLELWCDWGLDQKEDRYLSTLSGGEGQALKICLGLSVPKDLYFLDEPSQYLDERSRFILDQRLKKLLAKNISILLVEHDLSWLTTGADVYELKMEQRILKIGRSWNI
jgi:ABC-type Mn2+/Zn2+ transport system ATPase subunit